MKGCQKREPALPPVLLALTKGESDVLITRVNTVLQPVQHFFLNPSDPVAAKLYPLGELAGGLQARDVLGRVQNELLYLTLAQHSHHDNSSC